MEFNPSKTAAYLAGKIDEYVKFQGRDTVKRNAARDRNCRYARIPDGGACDFCRMLGSRGFVYHSEESAGGASHGTRLDAYHPYCNCQIAVCFDPFIEEYYSGWTKVTRGYGEGQVTVTGRDKSDVLRQVDIDELYAEYKAMAKDFNESGKSRYKDYTRGARLSDEAFDEAMKRLSDARTLDELHAVGQDIVDNWPKNANGRDKRQWGEMSRHARELEKGLIPTRTENMRFYTPSISVPIDSVKGLPEYEGPRQWQPTMTVINKPVGNQKTTDYSLLSGKEKKRLSDHEQSSHQLFEEYGFEPIALPEDRSASANIDLIMTVDGKTSYWELKDPEKGDRGQKKLTTEGVSKWQRMREGTPQSAIDINALETPRIAIDNRFNETQSDHDAIRRLVNDMAYYEPEAFNEAILVMKNGKLIHLKR